MERRTIRISSRLTKSEANALAENLNASGMSASEFVRQAIGGIRIRSRPSEEFTQMRYEIRKIGSDITQIAQIAKLNGCIGASEVSALQKGQKRIEVLLREML